MTFITDKERERIRRLSEVMDQPPAPRTPIGVHILISIAVLCLCYWAGAAICHSEWANHIAAGWHGMPGQ